MKRSLSVLSTAGLLAIASASSASAAPVPRTPGHDVSNYQGTINWNRVSGQGAKFTYIYASQGLKYRNAYFGQQYNGSYKAGLIRGAYHFAEPNISSGGAQARYFVRMGGGWSKDGRTLPGAVDLEPLPGRGTCYGMSAQQMRSWITDFSNTYRGLTKRDPVIYTTTSWWNQCTGSWTGAAARNPLWLASWSSTPGRLPAGWTFWTFWQTADHGQLPGDQDVFNGPITRLKAFANG